MDKDKFLNGATLCLCSSLNIHEALEGVRNYLKDIIPIDGLFINIYEREKKAIRTIACITSIAGARKNIFTPLTDEAVQYVEETISSISIDKDSARLKRTDSLKHPSESILGRIEAPILGYEDRALMGMHLEVEGRFLGVIVASARPASIFNDEHIDLFDSLHKPFTLTLVNALTHEKTVALNEKLVDDNSFLKHELNACKEGVIIGSEGGLKNVMDMVERVAPLNNSVLLLGETGVGKEIVANAIHCMSNRKDGPLIKVNCGAIPENLIDSELFGHEKGAFTGATCLKKGRFERAQGGTLFLDEVGELPLSAQVRLLRVLQSHEIERVGGTQPLSVDIRVIAATHRNLQQMVSEQQFREDLWFRLNVFPIDIPPLRQRVEDIPGLIKYFIPKKSFEMGLGTPPEISKEAMDLLLGYSWWGNVRELENVIERALIRNQGRQTLSIDPLWLSTRLGPLGTETESERSLHDSSEDFLTLNEMIYKHIEKALEQTKGKVNGSGGAAELLDIHPNTLRNRMKKVGLRYGSRYQD